MLDLLEADGAEHLVAHFMNIQITNTNRLWEYGGVKFIQTHCTS